MASAPLPVTATPRAVMAYGAAGLIPFLAPPLAALLLPVATNAAGLVAAVYAALILSFLGGARWGFEVVRPAPRAKVVGLAMLPTLAGLVLLLLPAPQRPLQLAGLAALLGLHMLWDVGAAGLPGWYPRLRGPLTAGAMVGLLGLAALIAARG